MICGKFMVFGKFSEIHKILSHITDNALVNSLFLSNLFLGEAVAG
jgi:hypothetical protein